MLLIKLLIFLLYTMKRVLIIILVLLLFPFSVFAETISYYYYDSWKVYNFRNAIKWFSITQKFTNWSFLIKDKWNFIVINQKDTSFQKDLNTLKKKLSLSQKIVLTQLALRNYNSFYEVLLKTVFSESEYNKIKLQITKEENFKILSWTRPKITNSFISREQWWANEKYWTPEYYLKNCESWNCWSGAESKRTKTIRENYKNYFHETDNKIMTTKKSNLTEQNQNYYPVSQIILHHTATKYTENLVDSINEVRKIYKYHSLDLWWWDIWYHYLIDWEWRVFEWNRGWLYSEWAHVVWHNQWTVWISLMTDWYISDKMYKSLKELILDLNKTYNLDLNNKVKVRCELLDWLCDWYSVIAHKELDWWKPLDPTIEMSKLRNELKKK